MPGSETGRVFISYRRQETAWPARQLYELLTQEFGSEQIFKDVDDIDPGDNFVERLTEAVGSCDVLLALIGTQWSTVTDAEGRRRLDDPHDFVRIEVATALRRPDVRVIPVLVDAATMPSAEELPFRPEAAGPAAGGAASTPSPSTRPGCSARAAQHPRRHARRSTTSPVVAAARRRLRRRCRSCPRRRPGRPLAGSRERPACGEPGTGRLGRAGRPGPPGRQRGLSPRVPARPARRGRSGVRRGDRRPVDEGRRRGDRARRGGREGPACTRSTGSRRPTGPS